MNEIAYETTRNLFFIKQKAKQIGTQKKEMAESLMSWDLTLGLNDMLAANEIEVWAHVPSCLRFLRFAFVKGNRGQ